MRIPSIRANLKADPNLELLDPNHICHVYVSPRLRARNTFEVWLISILPTFIH